ncbi:hypothetical protein RvY_18540 [Ramazzottius varieornatus]|uniref:Uncharacterized protein n=1 Tax=Ramazzottius varieornatus TaxID=947166 RepID=A0A1D1W656_RAMVA|nr:hypothetical protein RvY_18540 [Ramazzottius varieornatus]
MMLSCYPPGKKKKDAPTPDDIGAELEELKRLVWGVVKISRYTDYALFTEKLVKLPIAKSSAHAVAAINVIMEGVFRSMKGGTNVIYGTTLKKLDNALGGGPMVMDKPHGVSKDPFDFHTLVVQRIQYYFDSTKSAWCEAYGQHGGDMAVAKGIIRLTGITRLLVGVIKPDETRSRKFLSDEAILKYCQELIPDWSLSGSLSVLELYKAECLFDLLRTYCDANRHAPAQLELTKGLLGHLQNFFGVKTKPAAEVAEDVWNKLKVFEELIAERKEKIPRRFFSMRLPEPFPAPVAKVYTVTVLKSSQNSPKEIPPKLAPKYAAVFDEVRKLYRMRRLNGYYQTALAKKPFAPYTSKYPPPFHYNKWLTKTGTPEQVTRAKLLQRTVADVLDKPKNSKVIRESFDEYYSIIRDTIELKMHDLVAEFPKNVRDEILLKPFLASV